MHGAVGFEYKNRSCDCDSSRSDHLHPDAHTLLYNNRLASPSEESMTYIEHKPEGANGQINVSNISHKCGLWLNEGILGLPVRAKGYAGGSAEGIASSPSQRAMTAQARQFPITLTAVRPMSMRASTPRIKKIGSVGK
jgi:hypothetical protein